MPPDTTRVALLVTDALERLSIAYMVEGSLAKSDYGVRRSALMAHIIADIQPKHVEPFVSALSTDFYTDHHRIEDAIKQQGSFALVHYATKLNVDVFIPKQRPFDQMQLKRRIAATISTDPPRQVSVTSPEDAILSKLNRYRTNGGDGHAPSEARLVAEVIGMLRANAVKPDQEYMRHWARELMVDDLLERALSAGD